MSEDRAINGSGDGKSRKTGTVQGRDSHTVKIVTNFADYQPPFDVEPVISRMLAFLPEEYLLGLSKVVLTSIDRLSRKGRRSTTKSRGRKVRITETRGLYYGAWKGEAASIEIFVDRTLRMLESSWLLKLSPVRDILLAQVFFHEVGHHIHATSRPEHREREDVAEDWEAKLSRQFMRKRHPWLIFLLFLLRPFRKLIEKRAGGPSPRRLRREARKRRAES